MTNLDETDGSLTFSLDEINEASFKVIVNDTLSSCLSGATYKVSVAGSEEFEVADGEVSGATVPLCIGVELVLTRYLNDVQIGTSSTVTNFTHFGNYFLQTILTYIWVESRDIQIYPFSSSNPNLFI